MDACIASINQGTLNSRCVIFDRGGIPLALSKKEHRQIYLLPDRVEQRPLEIWKRVQEVIQGALSQPDLQRYKIAAVGVTNQRETTIIWDKRTGEPYYNAIVWQDMRTRDICNRLIEDGCQNYFRSHTGLPLATYFSGPKIKWILENIPGVRTDAQQGFALFGNVDTWLIWWLTGGPKGGAHVSDVTNASRTLLMDLSSLDWDDEILRILSIPRQMLPRIVPSSDSQPWGLTSKDGPFGQMIPVCGDLGDQQAALVGQACYQPGDAKTSYGTGSFTLLNTGTSKIWSKNGLLTTVAFKMGNAPVVYALEGSNAIAGALLEWLRDNLGIIHKTSEIEDLAKMVHDNGGVYFVPAFYGLLSPHWRSDARGIVVGLSRYVNKGHLARAALEAIAYQVREVLEAMQEDYAIEPGKLKVDGPLTNNNLLMSLQADVMGVPIICPKVTETTSAGAAFAAGLAVGFWGGFQDLQNTWQVGRSWSPHWDAETRNRMYSGWLQAVKGTLSMSTSQAWSNSDLA
ncbi:MAG TPA: glycerol kinase GlpK [Anaerolineales bacterium]|nr:glycerol kinase GlpK [Anaerolineales bacterium]